MNEHMQFLAGEPFSARRQHLPASTGSRSPRLWNVSTACGLSREYEAETARMREELGVVKQRDQAPLGRALADDEPEPEPEAPAVEEAIESNRQRSEALFGAIVEEQRHVSDLIVRHKGGWSGDVQRHLADKAAAYRIAVVEMSGLARTSSRRFSAGRRLRG
ncbi:MAG TPA: hypothetical protein VN960_10240 [Gaiellaceae bacterium]|nr:hypothetical protein [Gaiellaceae bacterium]